MKIEYDQLGNEIYLFHFIGAYNGFLIKRIYLKNNVRSLILTSPVKIHALEIYKINFWPTKIIKNHYLCGDIIDVKPSTLSLNARSSIFRSF